MLKNEKLTVWAEALGLAGVADSAARASGGRAIWLRHLDHA